MIGELRSWGKMQHIQTQDPSTSNGPSLKNVCTVLPTILSTAIFNTSSSVMSAFQIVMSDSCRFSLLLLDVKLEWSIITNG